MCFYHVKALQRRRQKHVQTIKDNNEKWLTRSLDINNSFKDSFNNFTLLALKLLRDFWLSICFLLLLRIPCFVWQLSSPWTKSSKPLLRWRLGNLRVVMVPHRLLSNLLGNYWRWCVRVYFAAMEASCSNFWINSMNTCLILKTS